MIEPRQLTPQVQLRIADLDDAPALADAYARSWDHLSPWEPARPDNWFTPEAQADRLKTNLTRYRNSQAVPWLLISDGRVLGGFTLNDLVPGPFRSAALGYWLAIDAVGQGLATLAVNAVAEIADHELKLHRIEASCMTSNAPSQAVLKRTGFQQIGFAPTYLHIRGAWQDCNLYQRILNDREPGA
ncbi:GNAT family protein [Kribbella sp. NPDC026611]|uniref:GNAT family N-acetyltransferase n=1 Tax=Kribbella sp. NPDC026611 TaxID=3154911 RepID=UPI0033DE42FD